MTADDRNAVWHAARAEAAEARAEGRMPRQQTTGAPLPDPLRITTADRRGRCAGCGRRYVAGDSIGFAEGFGRTLPYHEECLLRRLGLRIEETP